MITRRSLLACTSLVVAGGAAGACTGLAGARPLGAGPGLIDDIAERSFRFFWETTNSANGLAPDRWPSAGFCSIAAVGFALTAYPIGVERGWVRREEAVERTLTTLRFFWRAPQGPGPSGTTGHKGFFYHFLDMQTGLRFGRTELSSVDTSLLLGGILFAASYFTGPSADEREIRALADSIHARVDWRWMQARAPLVSMGWHPESGFIASDWKGYNEAMLVYVLGLGAPDPARRLGAEAWQAWTASYPRSWRGEGQERHLAFGPHFGHQYSHVWIDFRGIRDAAMKQAGFDYFENSRRATYAQRDYAARNPMGWNGYDADVWGLTACDGPLGGTREVKGQLRQFRTYSARGPLGLPDAFDDGTLAPTAALGSIAFAPEIVMPCVTAMHARYGRRLYAKYGFLDSFNPTLTRGRVRVEKGTLDPELGWFDDEYLGIDQGPILAMIANHQDEFIWKQMQRAQPIRKGLLRAGFSGGWLGA